MKSYKIYFIIAALGALFLMNFAHASKIEFQGIMPAPQTNYYYIVGSHVPVSTNTNNGTGSANYLYSWSVAADSPGTCPNFTAISQSPSNSFIYTPNAPTKGCVLLASALDTGSKVSSQNYTSEETGTIIVNSSTSQAQQLSISQPTAPSNILIVDENALISDTAATGGTSPYNYQWLEEDPGFTNFVTSTNCTPALASTSCTFSTVPSAPVNGLNNPQGIYRFELSVTDASGNTVNSLPIAITLVPPKDFPFNCSSENSPLLFHIHPYLQISINGQNVSLPAGIGITQDDNATYGGYFEVNGGACIEPMHTHDSSGIIHIESPITYNYTLQNFFTIWNDTYRNITINGNVLPVEFIPGQNVFGLKPNGAAGIVTLVDGHPFNPHAFLDLDKYDYCNMTNGNVQPCYETVGANPDFPFWYFKTYPYGTGHTIEILYTSNQTSASTPTATNTLVDQGQFTNLTSSLPTTGNAPFTYNWLVETPGNSTFTAVSNTMCATPSGVSLNMGENESCVFATNSNTPAGSYSFELQTNSSTAIVNVSAATSISVEEDPSISLSASNTVFFANQITNISATVSNGVGPFNISFYFPLSNAFYGEAQTQGNIANEIFPAIPGSAFPQSYTMNAVGVDVGTTTPFAFAIANTSDYLTFNVYPLNATLPTTTSTSTTSTSTTSTISSGGGGGGGGIISSGGGGGGGGGSGSAKPIITNTTNGFTVNTLAQLGSFGNVFCGQIFHVTNNYITPTSTGVTINGHVYSLELDNITKIYNTNCYVELMNISYLPILQSVTLKFSNGTTATVTGSNALSTNGISPKQFNVSFTVSYGIINVNSGNFTALSAIVNASNSTPNAPFGLEKFAAYNVIVGNTVNASDTIGITMPYNCSINGVEPYILKNGTWVAIKSYKANTAKCTLQFVIPADPVVGLMAPITKQTTPLKPTGSNTSGTITPQTQPQVQPVIVPTVQQTVNAGIGQAKKDAVAGVLVLAGILAILGGAWAMDRQSNRRRTGRKTGNPNAAYKKRRNGS